MSHTCDKRISTDDNSPLAYYNNIMIRDYNTMASVATKGSGLLNRLLVQARPQLDVFLKYAKVELTPPTPGDIPAIRQSIVKEAWLNTLVTAEVIFWFYIGECIGKRHLVGYNV
ncbi:hypothetical protein ACLKA6_016920 [Drosophila palustris]